MTFIEALEKLEPEQSKPDPQPAAVTAEDLKNIMNTFKESIEQSRESLRKEILEELKASNASGKDAKDNNNNPEKEEIK